VNRKEHLTGTKTMRNRLSIAATVILTSTSICSAAEPAATKPLPAFVENGQAAFRIEVGANATDVEKLAVVELSRYLGRVTGATGGGSKSLEILGLLDRHHHSGPPFEGFYDGATPSPEGIDGRKERIIYVGWTDFARANGLDGAKMQPDEWAVKTVGSNLILTGGRPRGTLWAVYDFLERDCGVWWFDRDTELVPRNPGLALPDADRHGKPKAWFRWLGSDDGQALSGRHQDSWSGWKVFPKGEKMEQLHFEVRNRAPRDHSWWGTLFSKKEMYGLNPYTRESYTPVFGSLLWDRADIGEPLPPHCHSFYWYLLPGKYYAEHPEYFGFTRENAPKELPTAGKGRVCLTNPDVRRIITESLMDMIRRDRLAERSFGTRAPRVYDLSQDDDGGKTECPCAACRDFVKTHGAESDLLIDFVNAVAAAVEKEYPDVTVETLAYQRTMPPPQTVKPRGNVLVSWCNWGGAGVVGGPFLDQALTSPENAQRLGTLRGWRDTGARLGVWEYMEYAGGGGIPATFAPYAIGNYEIYNQMGVEYFIDCSIGVRGAVWNFENFEPLRRWITLRLMADPACNVPEMLGVFFRGYYGPAAKPMRAFYDLLVANQAKPRAAESLKNGRVDYLTPEFYLAIQRLLDEAEAAAAADPGALLRVKRERPRVDKSMLDLWGRLERQLPDDESLPFERAKVIERFAADAKAVTEGFSWNGKADKAKAIEEAVAGWRDARLPEPFASLPARDLVDVTDQYFVPWHLVDDYSAIVRDPEAAGLAMAFGVGWDYQSGRLRKRAPGWAKNPTEFQIADLKLALTPEQFPRDGKYHIYKLGRTRLDTDVKRSSFKVLMNGRLAGGIDAGGRLSPRDRAEEWDVYVSAKLAGPSFAKSPAGDARPVWDLHYPADPSFAKSPDMDHVRVDRVLLVRAVPGLNRP